MEIILAGAALFVFKVFLAASRAEHYIECEIERKRLEKEELYRKLGVK